MRKFFDSKFAFFAVLSLVHVCLHMEHGATARARQSGGHSPMAPV